MSHVIEVAVGGLDEGEEAVAVEVQRGAGSVEGVVGARARGRSPPGYSSAIAWISTVTVAR